MLNEYGKHRHTTDLYEIGKIILQSSWAENVGARVLYKVTKYLFIDLAALSNLTSSSTLVQHTETKKKHKFRKK